MTIINRREFIKLSALSFMYIYTECKIPIYASNKNFKPFKFAFLPDLHLSMAKQDSWILLNESLMILQDVVKSLNNLNIDFVFFGGDLIDNELKDLSELSTLLDVLTTLDKQYYVILGNREARLNNNLTKEDFVVEFRRYGFSEKGRTYWKLNPVEGVDLIGLDSSVINQMEGEISPQQMVWLSSILQENPNNLKIVALHHPLIPNAKPEYFYNAPGFTLNNSESLIGLLERNNNVSLVLSGHHHVNQITSKNGVHYVNSPSIVTCPCEYRIIEVNKDSITIKNAQISFKQMLKKAEEQLLKSSYIKQFENVKPKEILKLHKGDKAVKEAKLNI